MNNNNNNNNNNELTFKKRIVNENRHTGAGDDKKTKSTNWIEKSWVNVWNSPETQINDAAQTTVFQASGPDVENAQGPNVTACVLGTRNWLSFAERSREPTEAEAQKV